MDITRRNFVQATGATLLIAQSGEAAPNVPWFRKTYRWGQTNITEKDPIRYDIPWWREFWKRTLVQGVIINGGGIVAYYPSKFPLQHQAEFLNGRDLYGELCNAAREDGLVVLARMDSNRTSEDFFQAHPDWFARDVKGNPYRAADKYVTCVNSAYYEEYIPDVMREIIDRSKPEGLTDNSWSGLGRDSICYCENCARKFRDYAATAIPGAKDWSSPVYRKWIAWNYERRLEIWDLNNRVTKAAGGPNCLWIGMNSGSIPSQSRSFRDCKKIWERADILMLDHQARGSAGFQENADAGKTIHGIMGWDKLIPESMAMYQAGGRTSFRLASKPTADAHLWMFEGFAGGIQPWWHHIGAYHEDKRMYATAEPVMRWYKANERYMLNRVPAANVGMVWSQDNTDFYGHDDAEGLVEAPYRGFQQALLRARIPYVPVHIDKVAESTSLKVLILPNIACMSDAQAAGIRAFVQRGGALIATGVTSLYDEQGNPRLDFALADLFGAHSAVKPGSERKAAAQSIHTYLRLTPGTDKRHLVLDCFDGTETIPFGGMLLALKLDPKATVLLTFIPEFPMFPPETSWMREAKTDIPGLVLNGRVAYLPADLDRRYLQDGLPDHANLLASLVRWAAQDSIPIRVTGHGVLDCNLYLQNGRTILHIVNLTNTGTPRAPVDDLISVGPIQVSFKLPAKSARLLVAGTSKLTKIGFGWTTIIVDKLVDHEVIVI